MTSDRLRRYQREALRGKADLLADRVRLGRLAPERLGLAAYLGDPAARLALGRDAPPEEPDLEEWVLGLDRWGDDVLVRATFAAVGFAVPVYEARFPGDHRLRQAVAAAGAWAACPCPRHGLAAASASRVAEAAADEARRAAAAAGDPALEAAYEAAEAVAVVTDVGAGDPARYSHYAARAADTAVSWVSRHHHAIGGDVRAGIREALVPWALERGDPLAE